MTDPLEDGTIVVPRFVTVTLERSSKDLEWIDAFLGRASDVEWVSDTAALYLCRLDHARRMILDVHTRVREAATAVRVLSLAA